MCILPHLINSAWHDALLRESMVFCNKCGKDNPAESDFCIFCGAKMDQPVSIVRICQKCGSENPDEATYCLKCGSSLTVYGPGEDEVMSKLSPLEQATTRNLTKEKCQRYRAPAIILSLISGFTILIMLFAVNVELVYGPGAMIELSTNETLYHIVSEMGAQSVLSENILSILFWMAALLAVVGLFIPLVSFFSGFIGFFMMMLMTSITVDVSILDVNAEVPFGFPIAVMLIAMIISGIAAGCSNYYGVQFRTVKGKACIQEYCPFC